MVCGEGACGCQASGIVCPGCRCRLGSLRFSLSPSRARPEIIDLPSSLHAAACGNCRTESGPDGKRLFRIRLVAKYAAPPMSSSQYPGGDGPMGFALGSESEGERGCAIADVLDKTQVEFSDGGVWSMRDEFFFFGHAGDRANRPRGGGGSLRRSCVGRAKGVKGAAEDILREAGRQATRARLVRTS